MTPGEKNNWKFVPNLSLTLHSVTFAFAESDLYPFDVINKVPKEVMHKWKFEV